MFTRYWCRFIRRTRHLPRRLDLRVIFVPPPSRFIFHADTITMAMPLIFRRNISRLMPLLDVVYCRHLPRRLRHYAAIVTQKGHYRMTLRQMPMPMPPHVRHLFFASDCRHADYFAFHVYDYAICLPLWLSSPGFTDMMLIGRLYWL